MAAGGDVQRLLIATTNRDKFAEIRQLLETQTIEVTSLLDRPRVPEPDETGTTFAENARLKAQYYDRLFEASPSDGQCVVAEDSGLVIDALGGEPGIYSARFVRTDASYPEKFAEIYRRLAGVPSRERTARFVCAVAVVARGEVVFETTGTVEGTIADTPRGAGGFGYDPIFFYPPYGMTLGEVSTAEKLRIAHRSVAIRRLVHWLQNPGASPQALRDA
jgi:XTP/dITP diphosphohydrolase